MIYTVLFYLLLLLCATLIKDYGKAIKTIVCIIVLYMGLRYNYMPDYKNYLSYFEYVSNGYIFSEDDHMEYGWYLLNKFFAPAGFFAFEFLSAVVMGWGIYLFLKNYVTREYLPYVVLGFVSTGSFPVLLSAHRQYVVAAIFMVSFFYLIFKRIEKPKDILNWRTILYFVIIHLCSQLHSSASFLYIVPFLYFVPSNKWIAVGVSAFLFYVMFWGQTFLPSLFQDAYQQYERYENILEHEIEMEHMTFISFLSYSFQILALSVVWATGLRSKNDKIIVLLAWLAIFFALTIFSLSQLYRLSMYFMLFSFLAIQTICRNWQFQAVDKRLIKIFFGVWIFWNALKVFNVVPGSVEEYKTIFSAF